MAKNEDGYKAAQDALRYYRDVTKTTTKSISAFSKEDLLDYIESIGSNEKNLRNISRYLYYRSHIYFRLVQFYSGMFDLRCRKVIPSYDMTTAQDKTKFLENYQKTIDQLDKMNLQGAMKEVLDRCFVEDVCYALFFQDENGSFFYILDPDYCKIDSRYSTGDFGFAVDMSHWRSQTMQQELEWLGEPMTSMYEEYQKTNVKWVHCDDQYAACFKYRTDTWDAVIPPFLSLFISLINLEDLADVQAVADEQQIYKLVYLPMKTLSGANKSDDFEVSPDLMLKYFDRMVDEALPDYVAAAPVPGDGLDYIDFSEDASTDTDRLEQAASTILNTSGGGMVLNTSKITTQAGFQAALKCETEFAVSPLLPQIDGFANRMLIQTLGDSAGRVEHFEVSIYTKEAMYEKLLQSCQHGFSNRLALNTFLGIKEKDTIAMEYLEEQVLDLPSLMDHPLSTSYTQSSSSDTDTDPVVGGRPSVSDDELSDDGSRSRNEASE